MEYVTFPDCDVSKLKFGYFGRVVLASGFLLLARAPQKGVRMESRGFYSQLGGGGGCRWGRSLSPGLWKCQTRWLGAGRGAPSWGCLVVSRVSIEKEGWTAQRFMAEGKPFHVIFA